jgi:hypothetical protein
VVAATADFDDILDKKDESWPALHLDGGRKGEFPVL